MAIYGFEIRKEGALMKLYEEIEVLLFKSSEFNA